jgi:ribosomal protein S18 acetylase RimI-like enzyme
MRRPGSRDFDPVGGSARCPSVKAVDARQSGGVRVAVRQATEDDHLVIVDVYQNLSSLSQRMRFGSVMSEKAVAQATALDGDCVVLVAVEPSGRVLGEVRIGSAADVDHEFALTVAEGVHRRGVGTALLEALRAEARARAIIELRAVVRIDNVPMLALLRRIGAALVWASDGEVVADTASDDLMPGWPSDAAGHRGAAGAGRGTGSGRAARHHGVAGSRLRRAAVPRPGARPPRGLSRARTGPVSTGRPGRPHRLPPLRPGS